jgi:hypothetical protein
MHVDKASLTKLIMIKREPLALKDYITILLSVSALILSIIGLYYNNFFVLDKMQVSLTLNTAVKTQNKRNGYHDGHLALIFTNPGNRQGVVERINYSLKGKMSNNEIGENTNSDSLPFVLQPHEIKILDLKLSGKFLADQFELGDTAIEKRGLDSFVVVSKFGCRINIWAIDSKGKLHIFQSIPLLEVKVDKRVGEIGMKAENNLNGEFPPMNLYD